MADVLILRDIVVQRNTTQAAVADQLGINRSTFYRKVKGEGHFTVEEVCKLAVALSLTSSEVMAIFYPNSGIVATDDIPHG